jgi:hypothetical protein
LVVLGDLSESLARRMIGSPEFRAANRAETFDAGDDEHLAGGSRRFVALAYECLAKGRMSKMRFAELMDIKLCDVDRFLADRGYGAVTDEPQTRSA